MKAATRVIRKKRPSVTGVLIGVRLQPADLQALDQFIHDRETTLTRPEAIRLILSERLVELGLKGKG